MGFGTSASLEKVAQYQDQNGFPWTFAVGPAEMARQFGIRVQTSKVGISADGVIILNEGHTGGGEAGWRKRLDMLVAG